MPRFLTAKPARREITKPGTLIIVSLNNVIFLTNANINLGPFNYYVIHHGEEGWGYVKI